MEGGIGVISIVAKGTEKPDLSDLYRLEDALHKAWCPEKASEVVRLLAEQEALLRQELSVLIDQIPTLSSGRNWAISNEHTAGGPANLAQHVQYDLGLVELRRRSYEARLRNADDHPEVKAARSAVQRHVETWATRRHT